MYFIIKCLRGSGSMRDFVTCGVGHSRLVLQLSLNLSLPSHSCREGVSTHPALLQGGWVGPCRQKGKDTRRAKDAFTSQKGPKARQTWGERKEEREREREMNQHGNTLLLRNLAALLQRC